MVSAYIIQANSVFPFIKSQTINKAVTTITDGIKPLFYKILNEISSLKSRRISEPAPVLKSLQRSNF